MKQLGEILGETCNLPPQSISQALNAQRDGDGAQRIGEVLIKNREVDEVAVLKALGQQLQMEVMLQLPSEIDTAFAEKVGIGFLKKNKMVPVMTTKRTFIAVNDPALFQPLDELRYLLGVTHARPVLCPTQSIISMINHVYDMAQDSAEEVMQDMNEDDPEQLFSEIADIGDLLDDTSDSPVIRLVNFMFSQAVRDGASDIHIEPYQNSMKIRQRLDGMLHDMFSPPKHAQSSLISRVKIMANLDIAEKRLPQDGRIELKVGNKEVDVRVSTLPTAFGERVVMRLLDKSSVLISLSELGMPDDRNDLFKKEIRAANGIVLVTGPTGSGKTTTLYAALTTINNSDINIITVEDPIEYRISGIGQVQVNPKINLTFASGLRSIVRQDPDVILVGEIRDTETAGIAIQAALTGHLVFSTLHTNDSASAVTRLRDMGIEPFLIVSSVNAILAQRLVRLLCEHCKEPYLAENEDLAKIGIDPAESGKVTLFKACGCVKCHHTGYRGRAGIFELLTMSRGVKSLVMQTADANAIKEYAVQKDGMVSLRQDGAMKVLAGRTTIEEVYRVCQA